ncbi:MAG: YitT family protein [Negativicutes bacterium]|jgi:uncharacterized membrane-anchored protein YitT (DUF2179 family)|nr:YitT family protein [Negativicutes bacterium]MBP8629244.1 YitT family protein [Negativicutes bacterium]MBP9537534.1 YitT family protein [Negativicutes bacterium]MBP9949741.1 YitT family protein [Negativicutes bacterium]
MQKKIRRYLGMTIGIAIVAIGINMFFVPNKIAAGGITGLATVLHYLSGLSVGSLMLIFNVPLFIIGIKILGAKYGLKTLYGAIALAVLVDVFAPYTPTLTHDILLNSIYGGLLVGVGMGLVFRFRGNTAGTALAAAILHKIFNITVGQALLILDFFVVAFAGIVFKSPELALYAIIAIFVTAKIIDLVQEGPNNSKAFFIMAAEPELLAEGILKEVDRGVTFLQGKGGYTGQDRELLLCVVETSEVTQLKELIYQHDPQAFIIVTDAQEVLGEGFSSKPRPRLMKE